MLIDKIKSARLAKKRPTILVIGDLMIDHYLHGKANRLSPEAPVPVVNLKSEVFTLGGAGNVVQNLVSLGAEVTASGAIGNDIAGAQVLEILSKEGVSTSSVFTNEDRITTIKTRILVDGHQLARLDKECTDHLSAEAENALMKELYSQIENADLVVLSDYNKGFLSPGLTRSIITVAKRFNKKVIVDPKGNNYAKYSGSFIIKPNRSELAVAAKIENVDSKGSLQVAASIVIEQTDVEYLIVTLSEDGIMIFDNNESTVLPVKATEVYDVTGAGDTVLSTISYFIALGLNVLEACEIANHAAAIVIRQIGSATVTVDEIIIELEKELQNLQQIN
ncbi:D-glycero-beta-D-manno-heptose-7-phosphate kinase [Mucilaginibacter psychrotolerans]|uniref:D-glycero-beta-D-manno-heptose-7-phosphate kinase n=1 Tax=Mucilaginibacter psychrotolerans TaxID=1524096 RepID=A0A4Y8SNC1_9SPHI|nr:D-glycero-beta-D-manno-heptose-7-phosphate kinase [Mucilaginibacter psychrotolerans]TFF39826.1 D-glycero-beta-D-manno-heptose-7-phosphate kinase [Mucilaginibacter psychrotolerans]